MEEEGVEGEGEAVDHAGGDEEGHGEQEDVGLGEGGDEDEVDDEAGHHPEAATSEVWEGGEGEEADGAADAHGGEEVAVDIGFGAEDFVGEDGEEDQVWVDDEGGEDVDDHEAGELGVGGDVGESSPDIDERVAAAGGLGAAGATAEEQGHEGG